MRLPAWLRPTPAAATATLPSPRLAPLTPGMPEPYGALTAAVSTVTLDGASWRNYRFGDRAWQMDAWRLYDITGQLRFVANWAGNSVSRCRLYVAEVDEQGEAGAEVEDPDLAVLASGPLGSGPAKDEALRLLGINLYVPGEAYVVAESDGLAAGEDRWWVVSGSQVRRQGGRISVERGQLQGGGWLDFRDGVDLLLRVWTPHPRRTDEPDSPARSAIPDLREIEALRKREFAELDSRLAGAGLLGLPEGIDFPRGDDDPPGAAGFAALLGRAMAASLIDRSSAEALVPIMFTAPGDLIDKMKHLTFATELSDQLLPLREAAIKSLAQSLDIPPEIMLGLGSANHWCTLPNVEIMTAEGWRTHDQLTVGEPVLTLNHDTGLSQWQPLEAVNTFNVADEPMVHITGKGHTSVTTTGHRWPILSGKPAVRARAWTTSGQLAAAAAADGPDTQRQDYLVLAAPHADVPTEAKYSDALVELVAWYYTEGDAGQRPGRHTPRVIISQSAAVNPDHCARIERSLTALFGPASPFDKGGRYATAQTQRRHAHAHALATAHPDWPATRIAAQVGVSATQVRNYLRRAPRLRDDTPRWRLRCDARPAGSINRYLLNAAAAQVVLAHAPARVVNLEFIRHLTAAQLELFLDVSVKADGWRMHTAGTAVLDQKDPARLAAFELAAILSGRSVNTSTRTTTGRTAAGTTAKTSVMVTAGTTRTTFAPRGRAFTTEHYTGTIWCPTTANGTWLARHNGHVFFTGNSAWAISEEAVTTQIVPLLSRIADALTTGYLRPALETMGVDPGGYIFAFDTAPLTTRPNRAADAMTAHKELLISDHAARDAGAWADDDAPDQEEILRRIVQNAAMQAPSVVLVDPDMRRLLGMQGDPAPVSGPGSPGEPPAPEGPPPPAGGPPAGQPDNTDTPPAADAGSTAALTAVAHMAVLRAMALAGGRLVSHRERDRYPGTPRHQLHTRHGAVTPARAAAVLRGAWDELGEAAADLPVPTAELTRLLNGYTTELLVRGMAHDRVLLADTLAAATLPRGPAAGREMVPA